MADQHETDADVGGHTPDGMIAYLTGEYPMASHTFIQREIEGVRASGVTVLTCAIRQPPSDQIIGPEEEAAKAETYYVLKAAKNPLRLVVSHLRVLARSPARYLAALRLALSTRAPGFKALIYQAFYFAEAGLLAEHLRARRVRHIHNHFADSSCTVAMLAARIADLPYSFTMHGPTEFFAVERWSLDAKIAHARFVSCISHFCRSQLMLFSDPSDWNKLKIVHCGVDPSRYGGAREATAEGVVRLLYVGRLAAVKGVRVLFEALGMLDVPGLSLEVTLAGDGSDRAALEAAAHASGLNARFLGYVSQDRVAELLRSADMLVLPSFAEGVPVVLMEAMASGVPVIATRVGGVSELVEHGVSGLLVAPGDPEGLAGAIARLATEPDTATSMGAAGRTTVASSFNIALESAKLASAFRDEPGSGDLQ